MACEAAIGRRLVVFDESFALFDLECEPLHDNAYAVVVDKFVQVDVRENVDDANRARCKADLRVGQLAKRHNVEKRWNRRNAHERCAACKRKIWYSTAAAAAAAAASKLAHHCRDLRCDIAEREARL